MAEWIEAGLFYRAVSVLACFRVGNWHPDVQRWMPDRPSWACTKFPCIPEIAITEVRLCWHATGISGRMSCRAPSLLVEYLDVHTPEDEICTANAPGSREDLAIAEQT